MSLQDELNELRAVVQALCDYVGREKVAAAMEENRKAREEAQKAAQAATEKTTP